MNMDTHTHTHTNKKRQQVMLGVSWELWACLWACIFTGRFILGRQRR